MLEIVFMLGWGWLESYCLETVVVDLGYHGMSLFVCLFLFVRVLRVGLSASGDFSPSLFAPGCK